MSSTADNYNHGAYGAWISMGDGQVVRKASEPAKFEPLMKVCSTDGYCVPVSHIKSSRALCGENVPQTASLQEIFPPT